MKPQNWSLLLVALAIGGWFILLSVAPSRATRLFGVQTDESQYSRTKRIVAFIFGAHCIACGLIVLFLHYRKFGNL